MQNEKMMVGMQGIGWCDISMGFRCVSGCSAVWVEIGEECVARESGVGWRIFANFGGIVATPLAFRAEMLANRRALCVTLHHRNATTPSDPAKPIKPSKAIIGTPQPHQTHSAHQIQVPFLHNASRGPWRCDFIHQWQKVSCRMKMAMPTRKLAVMPRC